jgi:hypothetical protein
MTTYPTVYALRGVIQQAMDECVRALWTERLSDSVLQSEVDYGDFIDRAIAFMTLASNKWEVGQDEYDACKAAVGCMQAMYDLSHHGYLECHPRLASSILSYTQDVVEWYERRFTYTGFLHDQELTFPPECTLDELGSKALCTARYIYSRLEDETPMQSPCWIMVLAWAMGRLFDLRKVYSMLSVNSVKADPLKVDPIEPEVEPGAVVKRIQLTPPEPSSCRVPRSIISMLEPLLANLSPTRPTSRCLQSQRRRRQRRRSRRY